jgi:hypothetical protein
MPVQASGLVQAAAQSPQAQRDGPYESEAMRSFVMNANERHCCGDDISHRFGPPASPCASVLYRLSYLRFVSAIRPHHG